MAKNVLIATLGESPIVVSSMVQALQAKKDMTIDQLHVIHPAGDKLIDLGYYLLKEHLNGECIVTQSILPFPDVNSRETSIEFLRVLSDSIQTHEDRGDSVYLSLAGGRKNMSALMAVTCQFFECVRGLYHVLDKYEGDPIKQNFHSIEALFDFEENIRGKKLSPPADELILVEIPYEQLPSGVALRQYLYETQSNPNVSPSIEIDDELEAFGREIFHQEKHDVLDVHLSQEAYEFYQTNNGETTKRLMSYFRSMRNSQALSVHKHDFKGDKTKTDCTCFKKDQTQLRLFYYQTNSQIVVATITGHRSESEYKRIINGQKQLYSKNHPPHIHLSKLKENSVLIAPLGKTPMVVTQTFVLLSAVEGADIERVIVIHPKNSEIRNGVRLLKTAFRGKECAITSIEIENIQDVASIDDCSVYLERLTSVITEAREDNPDKNIHLLLSGGRKGMAALTLFAAQQANIEAVYHTLIRDVDLEEKIEKETTLIELKKLPRSQQAQRLFLDDYDQSKFELVRVPVIPISIASVGTS